MARTPAQVKSLESKALAEENKSAGMRMLLEAGYSVTEVKDLFEAPYGYVYGVASRAGLLEGATNPREAKAEAPKTKAAPKAKAKAEAPAKAPRAPRSATAKASAAAKTRAAARRTAKA